jgi:pimeloyl-ACP methyl ester carboxylesterase
MIVANTLYIKCTSHNAKLEESMAKENSSGSWGYWDYKLHYVSKDSSGNDITLSERLVFPAGFDYSHSLKGLVLVNHPTIGANRECPTNDKDFLIGLAASDYAIVFPDLQGFGVSADRVHPYMCEDITARHSVDGLLAAKNFLSDRNIGLINNYGLVNIGYSQGGASAMAVHKYLENDCPQDVREEIRLKESYCGAGPYDPVATWETYSAEDELAFPCVLPMTILALKEGYPEEMKDINPEDCFAPALVSSGYINKIVSKEYTTSLLNAHLKLQVGSSLMSEILTPMLLDPESPERATILELLARNNLASGWSPKQPVYVCHLKNDNVVPYINTENALQGLSGGNIKKLSGFIAPGADHVSAGGVFYMLMMDKL